jgi:desulfoferrodoxin-like iron-binding protein
MRQYESYRCNKCGNVVEVQSVGGGELHCCGQAMEMITENLTLVNLMKSFAGESQARNKYEYFAKVAQKEGYRDIVEHFQRAANNEKQHAKMELALANRMTSGTDNSFGDTKANLQAAIDGESYVQVD